MASDETDTHVILHVTHPANSDHRCANVYRVPGRDGREHDELYKFYHPTQGTVTEFQRRTFDSVNTRFETAGRIEWSTDADAAVVYFGTDAVPMSQLRKAKRTSSKSRRFKADGIEYKWRIAENGRDLFCMDKRKATLAVSSLESNRQIIRIDAARGEPILDYVVVTFLLNLWMKGLGRW